MYGESVHPSKMTHTEMAFARRDCSPGSKQAIREHRACMSNETRKASHGTRGSNVHVHAGPGEHAHARARAATARACAHTSKPVKDDREDVDPPRWGG